MQKTLKSFFNDGSNLYRKLIADKYKGKLIVYVKETTAKTLAIKNHLF